MKTKQIFTTMTLLALSVGSTSALAFDRDGWYAQADASLSNVKYKNSLKVLKDLKKSYKESGLSPRLSLGYDFGTVRVAGDYTLYKKGKSTSDTVEQTVKTNSIGVSAIYDFPVDTDIQPYVGGRLGLNKVKASSLWKNDNKSVESNDSNNQIGAGLIAGVGYKMSNNLFLDAGYRYNRVDSKVQTHEASLGVRYSFY